MIIRNLTSEIIMIEQDHHAHISEEMIKQWIDPFLKDDPYAASVLYAIRNHDCGWRHFDKQPFWNDETGMPYAFTDFPVIPKTVLYSQGVDEIEAIDSYAAALCSTHYMKFISNNQTKEAKDYLMQEEERIDKVMSAHPQINSSTFDMHVAMLQFADNISLYICLNEPGVDKENEHFFFQKGIPISPTIKGIKTDTIDARWKDRQTVIFKDLPYVEPFTVSLQQKSVSKQAIKEQGILKSYEQTPYEEVNIKCTIK